MSDAKNRKQYYKDYFEKNKDKLREKFICDECGGKYTLANKTSHYKTKNHQNFLLIKKLQNDNNTMKNIISDIGKKIINV